MIPINGNFKSLYAHPGMPTEKEIKQSTHDLLLDKKKKHPKTKNWNSHTKFVIKLRQIVGCNNF